VLPASAIGEDSITQGPQSESIVVFNDADADAGTHEHIKILVDCA
jgi:hypothetical protein